MNGEPNRKAAEFRSRLSFAPLLKKWKEIISGGNGNATFFAELIDQFSNAGKLSHPIDDYSLLQKHKDLVDRAIGSLFPLTLSNDEANAITPPFSNKVVYASQAFKTLFMDDNGAMLPFDPQVAENIAAARIVLAYKIILKKYYGIDLVGGDAFICAYPDAAQNISNYFELTWNWQFVEVSSSIKLSPLPERFLLGCHHVDDLDSFPDIGGMLPLDEFIFDGFLLLSVQNVTNRESAKKIRGILQQENVFEDVVSLQLLKQQLQYYLQLHQVNAGITSFRIGMAGKNFFPQPSSIVLKYFPAGNPKATIEFLISSLKNQLYFFEDVNAKVENPVTLLLKQTGCQSALFAALIHENEVAGCLEIYFSQKIKNFHELMTDLRFIIPYFQTAMQQKENDFQLKINRVVKDHFTPLQPSVEWKFNETAVHYLMQPGGLKGMEPIVFDDVFPLYATFDIRNSSSERNRAVQQDLLFQLQAVRKIFQKAEQYCAFAVLQELNLEVQEYINRLSGILPPDEESVHLLLKVEIAEMLRCLEQTSPELQADISDYFSLAEKSSGIINLNQKKFEETVTAINHYLCGLVDREQKDAQLNYPHYFERFASDGVEFNIFIGQSITPEKKFSPLYLSNLRLWQLEVLALGARHLHQVRDELALQLETTQLVLMYNQPISIRFRVAERKFDVDGIHYARYEVVKKRIDKAYIKNSNERLTKPGTIAIVYFNESDIQEYYRYINFLKQKKLLEGEPEKLELEELQGVSGLKALRINLDLQVSNEAKKKSDPARSGK